MKERTSSDDAETSSNRNFGEAVLANFFKLYIEPEINRRIAIGAVTPPLELTMFQVLFPEAGPFIVRLNEEVRGEARLRRTKPLMPGEPVYVEDMQGIERFELLEEEMDFGHFTALLAGTKWALTFNFVRGRLSARTQIDRAEEFFIAAKDAAKRGHTAVAFDNLFSATELLARVHLELRSGIKKGTKTHATIHGGINNWRRLGNVSDAFTELFNKVSRARDNARYKGAANSDLVVTDQELQVVQDEIDLLRATIKSKVAD
jgi:hypothetical protein